MISKKYRIRKKKEVERIFKEGKKVVLPGAGLYLKLVANDKENSRFVFIISKKVSAKAVLRNKLKRKLSEIVRVNLERIKKGIDVAIVVFSKVEKEDLPRYENDFERLLIKSGILKK